MKRISALLLIADLGIAGLSAQGGSDGSPYSSYGLGDMLPTGQAVQAMMGGTGLALPEPYSVIPGNPASYPFLHRPAFEVGVRMNTVRSSSSEASSSHRNARFMGFSIGVPFGAGKWGLALGLTPESDVGYSLGRDAQVDGQPVKYRYQGDGGLNRAFLGMGRSLYRQQPDSLGNAGLSVTFGADFNFVFGSLDQTRDAIYSRDAGYSNIRAFSGLILRAPSADASLIWQGDLTRKKFRDGDNWRWTVGLAAGMPTDLMARYHQLVVSYVEASGLETIRDTVALSDGEGRMKLAPGVGIGLGVQNRHWGLNAEMRWRDWGGIQVDVPGYAMPAPMRAAASYAVAARYRPGTEGGAFNRSVYRVGLSYRQAPQLVFGQELDGTALSAGISIPVNAVQTNSWVHVGGEYALRGTTGNGLLRERQIALWLGLTFTPWRGERWFTPSKIQ